MKSMMLLSNVWTGLVPIIGFQLFVLSNCEHHLILTRYVDLESINNNMNLNVHGGRYRREVDEPIKPNIKSLHARTDIKSRFATTLLTTEMENTVADQNVDARFIVQFPETAFISNFTMTIGDDVFVGVVKEKEEAQKIYDQARDRNETAGIVKSHSNPTQEPGTDLFSISITLAASSSAQFELTYQELLVRKFGFSHRLYVGLEQPVANFSLEVIVVEPQGISTISAGVPSSYQSVIHTNRVSHNEARFRYSPTVQEQGSGFKGNLKVKYTVDHSCDAGYFETCSSFFVHYFSPASCSLDVWSRQIYFVIDISGSMSGSKMEKTRSAMNTILKLLTPKDRFGIVLFDDEIVEWSSEMFTASEANIQRAMSYCDEKLVADGSTNIYDALEKAIQRLTPLVSSTDLFAPYIMFLTDGAPNSGKFTRPNDIQREIKNLNTNRVPIYSIAFGAGANFDFLNALSYDSGGYAIKIFDGTYDSKDMSQQLTFFYNRIAKPVLKKVQIIYPKSAISENEVTDSEVSQYFEGSEITVVGKLQNSPSSNFQVKVIGLSTTGQREFTSDITPSSADDCDFIQRIYAYKWIKTLLLRASMELDETRKKSLEAEALAMSLQYNFVTPLTSMVVVQGVPGASNSRDMMERNMAFGPGRGNGQRLSLSWHLVIGSVLMMIMLGI